MRERTTEKIIQQSTDAESLLDALNEADETALVETLKPEMRRQVEETTRIRSIGSHGIGGFSI